MMTAITEINRSGAKSARGLVSIQSRYNQILDETSSTGAKLIDFYNKNNIQLYDQEGQLRSLWDTLSDVAEIWDTLDENEQKYFLNIQAGANQSVQLGALMSNFGTAVEATNTALNSSGSAMKENEAYMESLEAKTNLLQASYQELSNDVISKDMVSGVLDLANGFLQLADSEAGVTAVQAGLAGGLAMSGTALLRASKIVPNLIGSFRTLFTVLSGGELAADVSAFAGLPAAIGLATVAVVGFVAAFNKIQDALDPVLQINKAMEEFNSIQEKIDDGQNIVDLTNRYQELREKIQSGTLDEEEMASASQELDSVRQQLSEATGGLVDAEAEYGAQLDETIAKLQQTTEEEIELNNTRQLGILIDAQNDYNKALRERKELESEVSKATRAQAFAKEGWNNAEQAVNNFNDRLQEFYNDWYEGTANALDLGELRLMYAGLTGDLNNLTTAEGDFLEMARKGNAEINVQALQSGEAWSAIGRAIGGYQDQITEVDGVLSKFERGVLEQFVDGTIDAEKALNMLNDEESNNYSKSKLMNQALEMLLPQIKDGSMSYAEAAEKLGMYEEDIRHIVQAMNETPGATNAFTNSINTQVDALLSLEDELANAQLALAEYQAALEGGDRGDLADTLEGQYAQVVEDIQSGYVNTKQQDAFFKLIFDKDTYEQYADDFMARAEIFNQEWMQALFNTEEGATLGTNLLDIAEYYADATTGAWVSANGELIASFDTTTGQLNSINLDTLQQEFGFSDTLITAMADDLRGLGYDVAPSKAEILGLAESMGILSVNAQGVQSIDLGAFINGVAEMGRSEEEISTLVGYLGTLQDMGAIDITGTVDIEGADEAITKAIEAQDELDNLGNTTGEGTADVNTQPADSGIEHVTEGVKGISDLTGTATADLDTAPFDLGASAIREEVRNLNILEAHVKVYLDKQNDVSIPGNAEGTDFAEGGPTLINEEGPEIIRDGDRAYIANGGKPTVVDMPRGAQVFTARETKDILNGFNFDSIQALAVGAVGNSAGIKRQSSKWGGGSTSTATSPVTSAYSAGYDSGYTAASQDYSAIVEEVSATTSGALNEDTVKEHQNIISLLEAEYSLMEKQGASTEELNSKAVDIQNAYRNLNEYLRGTDEYLNGDNEVLKDVADNSAKWYDWQEKIVSKLIDSSELFKAYQSALESQLDVYEAQERSWEDQLATIKQYQANLHAEAERLREVLTSAREIGMTDVEIAETQTEINNLSKQWWEWQEKIYDAAVKTSREYDSIYGLLDAEFEFLEAQKDTSSVSKRIELINAEQDKLHEEAEILRDRLKTEELDADTRRKIEAEILGYSKKWWELEDKKTGVILEHSRIYDTQLSSLKAQYDLLEASGKDKTGRERLDILKQQQALYHEEAERLREILTNAKELKLTEEDIAQIQAEINGLSKQWWEDEVKKKNLLKEELDLINNNQKNAYEALARQMGKYYDEQIDAIDEQIDKLKNANDELEDQLDLEEKLDAIAQARAKKVMVYKNGRWQYVSDADAVSKATADYEAYQRKKQLDDAVNHLEKQKKVIEKMKSAWSDWSDKWNDIQDELIITQELGIDTSNKNWQKYLTNEMFGINSSTGDWTTYLDTLSDDLTSGSSMWNSFVSNVEGYVNRYITAMEKLKQTEDLTQYLDYNTMSEATKGYSRDIDYAQIMIDTPDYEVAKEAAAKRDLKIAGEGITGVAPTSDFWNTYWGEYNGVHYNKGIDYSLLIQSAKTLEEAQKWAAMRDAKIGGEGLFGQPGVNPSSDWISEWKQQHSYANGTLSASGGLSLVGEKGAELRILGAGDGILPNALTKNLMEWGHFSPNEYTTRVASLNNGTRMDVTIQALNLPNVTDGQGFVDYVKNNMFGQVLQLVH